MATAIDGNDITEGQDVKSLSREMTFETDTDNPALIGSTIDALTQDVCDTLTEERLRFRTVTLKIRYQGFITRSRSRSLSHFSGDATAARSLVRALFREVYDGRKIRLLGIRLSSFEKRDNRQVTLPL